MDETASSVGAALPADAVVRRASGQEQRVIVGLQHQFSAAGVTVEEVEAIAGNEKTVVVRPV